jgi:predicted O-methyltransferase YrrM
LAHGKNFDLIYVDGAHTFEHVVRDALYAIDLLRVGGVVVFDDCTMQAIRKTLRFLRRNYDGIVQEMDLDPFRPPLSIARRVAHYVGYTQARAFQRTRSGGRDWNARFRDF